MAVAAETVYLNKDKTKKVKEDSEEAAYLLCREGCAVSDEDVEKYGVKVKKEGETVDEPNLVLSGSADSGPAIVHPDESLDEADAKKASKKGK